MVRLKELVQSFFDQLYVMTLYGLSKLDQGLVSVLSIAQRVSEKSHYLHLMVHEKEPFSKEMVIRGTLERLAPVLMTALAAILGLIPLVLSRGAPGKEILHPVAVVIVGGLLSSTILDMWVTPAVFYCFGKNSAEKYVQRSLKLKDKELL